MSYHLIRAEHINKLQDRTSTLSQRLTGINKYVTGARSSIAALYFIGLLFLHTSLQDVAYVSSDDQKLELQAAYPTEMLSDLPLAW